MVQLEWVFLLQLVTGVWILMLLLRINKIKKQIDGIIKEVKNYVEIVTEEEEFSEDIVYIEETDVKKSNKSKKAAIKEREEAQNHLIQAVLKEYFP